MKKQKKEKMNAQVRREMVGYIRRLIKQGTDFLVVQEKGKIMIVPSCGGTTTQLLQCGTGEVELEAIFQTGLDKGVRFYDKQVL